MQRLVAGASAAALVVVSLPLSSTHMAPLAAVINSVMDTMEEGQLVKQTRDPTASAGLPTNLTKCYKKILKEGLPTNIVFMLLKSPLPHWLPCES